MASLRDPTAVLDPLRRSIIKRGLSILVCSGDVALSIGVDEMQRNFAGMRTQVEAWRQSQLSDVAAKLIIYRAFIESDLEVPKHLAKPVHELYFNPQHEEFQPRTMWSLSNAFTSAFKELEPIPQFRATAKLGGFLTAAAL